MTLRLWTDLSTSGSLSLIRWCFMGQKDQPHVDGDVGAKANTDLSFPSI